MILLLLVAPPASLSFYLLLTLLCRRLAIYIFWPSVTFLPAL